MSLRRLWTACGVLASAAAACLVAYLVRRDDGGIEGADFTKDPDGPRQAGWVAYGEFETASSRADLFLGASIALGGACLLLVALGLLWRRSDHKNA
jgi:hypothetical protein